MGAIALLEALDRDGMVRQAWRIEHWPVTIGRALDNDVVLTEPHVAPHHATIELVPATGGVGADSLVVTAGPTNNGLQVGRERIAGGSAKTFVDTDRDLDLQIGRNALRLRLPGHALAPEVTLAPMLAREIRWLPTAGLALASLVFILLNTYIDNDPDGLGREIGKAVLSALLVASLWCGFWALLSKIFARQSSIGWHVRVFVIATVATTIYFHLLAVEPGRERLMRAVAVTGFAVGVALQVWFNMQRTGRFGEELYMNHLFAPQLRLARPVPVAGFIDNLAPMQAILDKKAKEQGGGDDGSGEDDDE